MRQICNLRVQEKYLFDDKEILDVNKVLHYNYYTQMRKTKLTPREGLRFFMWLVANGKFDVDKILNLMCRAEPYAKEYLRYILD